MDMLLPGTMRMPMKTTKAIFGLLKITSGLTGRICTSSLVPLLSLLLIMPLSGAQAAVVFTSLYSFTGTNDGANPAAALVQGSDGNFYGTTQGGGTTNYNGCMDTVGFGTVFKISPNGALTSLYSFTGGNDGELPMAGLVLSNDGYFYGTTYGVGCYGSPGTVFKISPNGALTTLYSFGGGNDANPTAGLVQGSDGFFYGTTSGGMVANKLGTVFKISPKGTLTSLYSFTGGNDGEWPVGGLVLGSDGNFYGTTSDEWDYAFYGTVFRITTNGALTTLYSFTGGDDGSWPMAALVQGSDGYFYGTTGGYFESGGLEFIVNNGTIFKISTNGTLTTLYTLGGWNEGANPVAALVQGTDGHYYGTTAHNSAELWGGRY